MLKINKYNRIMAKDYALKYALTKNPAFFDYTNQGGNCTNYISQCVYAGAPKMQVSPNGWYYFSPANTSVSWANVEPFFNFIINNTKEGPFAKQSPLEMCEVGDIIKLKFKNKNNYSHALVVTSILSKTLNGIYVCANTRDIKEVPVSYYNFEQYRLIHILGYRVKS